MNGNKGVKATQSDYASTPNIVGNTPRGNHNRVGSLSGFAMGILSHFLFVGSISFDRAVFHGTWW